MPALAFMPPGGSGSSRGSSSSSGQQPSGSSSGSSSSYSLRKRKSSGDLFYSPSLVRTSASGGNVPDWLHSFDAYRLGDTFTLEEQDYLMASIVALNGAIVKILIDCYMLSEKKGIAVGKAVNGDGIFCSKGGRQGEIAAVYFGTLEVDTKYNGRRDYAIQLPPLVISKGGKPHNIILCGYEQRNTPLNAVMINHACSLARINCRFELMPVDAYACLGARVERIAMEHQCAKIPSTLTDQADKLVLSYFVVVAKLSRTVSADEELLVSYNGVMGDGAADATTGDDAGKSAAPAASTADDRNDYFMSDDTASRVMRKDEVKLPCRCEPGGCPMGKVFLLNRKFLDQPAPQP